jgi:AmmeMemoRadiSam system protein B
MATDSIRPAAVAGSWYPGTAGALTRDVDAYVDAVPAEALPNGTVDAVIAPHAGLMFSGPVGAFAYKAAAASGSYETAILVGPSHFAAFDGVSVYPSGAFETPLGAAWIDAALAGELMEASPIVQPLTAAHRREHSLEMQLPFVRRLLPDVKIVPLLMGYQTGETIRALADALASVVAKRRVLLVASTDLSHYFDAATAERLDGRVRGAVAAFDAPRLLQIFEEVPEGDRGRYVACGGGPMIAVMMAAAAQGARHGRVLRYMHSGEISGDNSGVVGYLAGALGTFDAEPRNRSERRAGERSAEPKGQSAQAGHVH